MTSSSLDELTARITGTNHEPNPEAPPAVAPQSPFLEVLIAEVLPSLPPVLAARLQTTAQADAVVDWLAAAAAYRWLEGHPHEQAVFMQHLGESPRQAACAGLRAALAASREPFPMDAVALRYDRLGMAWSVATALGFALLTGLLLFVQLGLWLSGVPVATGLAAIILFSATGSTILQAMWVPYLLEHLRRWPSRAHGRPGPASGRSSGAYSLWHGAHVLLGLVTGCMSLRVLAPLLVREFGHLAACLVVSSGTLLLCAGMLAAIRAAPRVWALSSSRPQDRASAG